MKIDELPFNQVCDVFSHDIQNNWDTTYSDENFCPSKAFDCEEIDRATNRHLQEDAFRRVPKMNALVSVFESSYNH
jgi:hypothetical protein